VGAKVAATNLNTGLTRDTSTANDGGYVFPLVPVGFYSITVDAQGFRRFEQRGVEVRTDQSASVPVSLQIGSATQSVTVEANSQMVQTQSGALSEVVSQRKIVELPLNGRNAATLVLLTPGTADLTPSGNGGNSSFSGCTDTIQSTSYPGAQAISANGARTDMVITTWMAEVTRTPTQTQTTHSRTQTRWRSSAFRRIATAPSMVAAPEPS
jgi:Carboxypeptidase regulatory-like domain